MTQLEMLWDYQAADMEADQMANDIKHAPNRVKLVESRDFLVEQQAQMKKIEGEVAIMADRVDAINDAMAHCQEQLDNLKAKYEETAPATLEDTQTLSANVKKVLNTIAGFEQELKKLKKDAQARNTQQHDIRREAAKVKAQFDQLKVSYDVEYKNSMKELDAKRAVTAQKGKDIAPDMLEKYKVIKRHVTPPIAVLVGNQCGGCNTILPGAVLRSIKDGGAVECENCGRLIISKE